jgi:DUF1365 family protein
MMKSCLYEGTIRHRRFGAVENAFTYGLFMVYLDLDELPFVFDGHPLWSVEKANVAYFRRRDHLGSPEVSLADAVRDRVFEETGHRLRGAIRLLTHLCYYGFRFNPVSFFYCFNEAGDEVEAIVAEVSNTPWEEQHPYVLHRGIDIGMGKHKRYQFDKVFHVSPFLPMHHRYDWHFKMPGDALTVHMNNLDNKEKPFDATLVMRRTEMTSGALTRVLVHYPWMTAKVMGAIYWQAFKLWWKKAPFYPHPDTMDTKLEVVK